jgi:protein arginine N-methyltransferase 1
MAGYSLYDYGRMIGDRVRMSAYEAALQRAVQPGAVVVDLGCGLGLFALLAARLGAARVHAIEPAPVIETARALALANGLAARITFWPASSLAVNLPEAADIIISDLRGALPLYRQHLPAIIDARQRFLKPGGRLIPAQDSLWAAVVNAPTLYARYTDPWDQTYPQLDLSAGRQLALNVPRQERFTPDQLLTPPQPWAELDYYQLADPHVSGAARWHCRREGVGHGLAVWFATRLLDDIGFSNAPNQPSAIYQAIFFPWERAIPLPGGAQVATHLSAHLVGDDYIWQWRTQISGPNGAPLADWRQSTFHGLPIAPPGRRRSESTTTKRR